MNYLKNPLILYGVILILLLGNIGEVAYIFMNKKDCPVCEQEELVTEIDQDIKEEEDNNKKIFVDIKGYVKKPGVYELENGAIINDLIKLAGGLKTNATTENINLSKKLVDEATVIISSKSELKKQLACSSETNTNESNSANISNFGLIEEQTTQNNSTNNQSNTVKGKVSINTASKEELMTLSGVGEKTAEKIIEYRNTQKFNTIEDIKNVSGIGEAVFEKIKDLITV